MGKCISKIAAKLGDVKIIVKIDFNGENNEMARARLNTVAAMVSNAFTPLRIKKAKEKDKRLEGLQRELTEALETLTFNWNFHYNSSTFWFETCK